MRDVGGFGNAFSAANSVARPRRSMRQTRFVSATNGRRLYNVTMFGGLNGIGSVYEAFLDDAGNILSLAMRHHFAGADGAYAQAVIKGSDGDLYGVTALGGPSNVGTVFRITQDGSFAVLHSFTGSDGNGPDRGRTLRVTDYRGDVVLPPPHCPVDRLIGEFAPYQSSSRGLT